MADLAEAARTEPHLWHVPLARSMRVLWLMNEIGLEHRLTVLDIFDGSLRREPYRSLSPAGRVPTLEIDGITLHESGAMIEYLCETRAPDLWRAPRDPERGAWLDWLHYAETLGQHLANLTQQHIVLREAWQRSPTVMKLEAARLGRALDLVETALDRRDWLLGEFTGVDCAVGYSVWLAGRFVDLDPRPRLAAYRQRCEARAAFQASLPPPGTPSLYQQDFYEVPDV